MDGLGARDGSEPPERIRVLLAEDMALLRGALAAYLNEEPDMEVVAEVDRGDDIVSTALRVRPDVAVIDIGLNGLDGLSAARTLRKESPECRSVILTGMGTARALREALEAKIHGFVVKDTPPDVLAQTIRRVANGEWVIDSKLAGTALLDRKDPLTTRERDVLELAAEGATVNEIASRLSLSVGTVRNYLSAVISKLGARNRIDAVRIARDAGWI